MATPVVKAFNKKNEKQVKAFFTLADYEAWKSKPAIATTIKQWEINYYKGLGTSTSAEAKDYFKELATNTICYTWGEDNDCNDSILLAFDKSKADDRKQWLGNYDKKISLDQKVKNVNFIDFVNKDLIHFSNYDNERSIPSVCDGFKPSQRKIIYGVLKRNLKQKMKVAQLSGYIGEKSAYHHGEASLHSTMISMANDFVGANNINLLIPAGQFGTRLKGGKDFASPRYISTLMSELTTIIFNPADSPLLKYLDDDGFTIEPEWYMPILPMILVNGCDGIGTGYSTQCPNYNPLDIVANIKRMMKDEQPLGMTPWYKGFCGSIIVDDTDINSNLNGTSKIMSKGTYKKINDTTIEITELPIGKWTDDYKEFLETIIIDKNISDEKLRAKQMIQSYRNDCTESTVKFTIKFAKADMQELMSDIDEFEKKLKLVDWRNTQISNMHLHDPNGKIKLYESPIEILYEFYAVRLIYYNKRKEFQLQKLQQELDLLAARTQFIEGVIDNSITISNVEDAIVFENLKNKGLPLMMKAHANNAVENAAENTEDIIANNNVNMNANTNTNANALRKLVKLSEIAADKLEKITMDDDEYSYDYLINMAVRSLTKAKVAELKKQHANKLVEYETLNAKSPKDLWTEDLEKFCEVYKRIYKTELKNTLLTKTTLTQLNNINNNSNSKLVKQITIKPTTAKATTTKATTAKTKTTTAKTKATTAKTKATTAKTKPVGKVKKISIVKPDKESDTTSQQLDEEAETKSETEAEAEAEVDE
jgi:DNA topoisomerase-2